MFYENKTLLQLVSLSHFTRTRHYCSWFHFRILQEQDSISASFTFVFYANKIVLQLVFLSYFTRTRHYCSWFHFAILREQDSFAAGFTFVFYENKIVLQLVSLSYFTRTRHYCSWFHFRILVRKQDEIEPGYSFPCDTNRRSFYFGQPNNIRSLSFFL